MLCAVGRQFVVCIGWSTLQNFAFSLIPFQMITASAIVYADLIFLRIQTHGFFSEDWKMTAVVEEVSFVILLAVV
jgi:hypothetical protein